MMKNNTLNKETSKLIQGIGVEVKTEKWWNGNREWITKSSKTVGGIDNVVKVPDTKLTWVLSNCRSENPACEGNIPAPNFGETLLALEAIGKVMGWENNKDCGHSNNKHELIGFCQEWKNYSHTILDHFLTGGMPAVDSYIAELLK